MPLPTGYDTAMLFERLLAPSTIWFVLLGALVIFGLYSLLLIYHWFRYGLTSALMFVSMAVYFAGGAALFGIMFLAAAAL